MNKRSVFSLILLILSGCAMPNSSVPYNEGLEKKKAPTRLVQDLSFTNKNSVRYTEEWAGTKGTSIVNERYKKMLLADIEKKCGYGEKQFKEVYIVKHVDTDTAMILEEVWLFNDSESFRDDKISGQTVYLEYDKKTDKSIGDFIGSCHTGKGTSFTYVN